MLNEPADMLHFRDRVEHLKTSWAETRELRRLSAGRDLESQSQVLELLRQWFEGAAVQA